MESFVINSLGVKIVIKYVLKFPATIPVASLRRALKAGGAVTPATGRRDLAQAASDTAVRDSGTPACCHAAAATRRPGRGRPRRVRVAGAAEVTVTGYVSAGRPCWVAAGQCHVGPGAATVLRRLPWPSGAAAAGRPPLPRSVLVTAAAGGRRGPALAPRGEPEPATEPLPST